MRGVNAGAVLTVNTEQPLDNGTEAAPYEVAEDERSDTGMTAAIRVALEAARILA